ncbi:alpha/beta fold hydrolase [Paenibacillus sp. P26]|nr:alpha/beta fold hydrolase [Paenibacillus sp. P26]
MRLIFQDQTFSFELLRTMGYAPYGGADIGECLSTAYKIKEGDFESWYAEWYNTAERIHAQAVRHLEGGKLVSAREGFLRAHNYYRTAEFFLHGDPEDPRILETWGKSRSTFRQAIRLMDHPVEEVRIPYEGTHLPGYFYRVDDRPRPTLLVHGGFDSTQEELYLEVVAAALQRGYNCLTFEGPGQGAVIRERRIPFRYDWEKVVTPMVDYLETRPEVDAAKIALMGISLGGYLAPRAAAFEHRLAACIANDGMFSCQFGEIGRKLFQGRASEEELNRPGYMEKAIEAVMAKHTGVRWSIENGMFTHRADSIHELVRKTEPYTLEGVAHQVQCPTLVCEAENDHFFAERPQAAL